jgi:hypothetical protein
VSEKFVVTADVDTEHFEKKMRAQGRCIVCGQPVKTVTNRRGHSFTPDECEACFKQKNGGCGRNDRADFGAAMSSVKQEYKRRLGYGSGESSGPDIEA